MTIHIVIQPETGTTNEGAATWRRMVFRDVYFDMSVASSKP